MQEIVIVSGKGGTGKTSLTASFAILANNVVVADCDVDASDLHLLLKPVIQEENGFTGGKKAYIHQDICTSCYTCFELCRFHAIKKTWDSNGVSFSIDTISCEGCGVCVWNCPLNAITFNENQSGNWFVSQSKAGMMVHARLFAAQENSGKLVSQVRKTAREIAESIHADILLIDGPPGISCPVIASITNTHKVVIVIEPSLSGIHDMLRIHELIQHFRIPAYLIINKWDLDEELTRNIEKQAQELHITMIGKIPYHPAFLESQIQGKCPVEENHPEIITEIQKMWNILLKDKE